MSMNKKEDKPIDVEFTVDSKITMPTNELYILELPDAPSISFHSVKGEQFLSIDPLDKQGSQYTIKFNRDMFPDLSPGDFAEEFIDAVERSFFNKPVQAVGFTTDSEEG